MNHISRRNSIVYDIHKKDSFIFRVDFHYNGQWTPENHDIANDNASNKSAKDLENKAKEHRILRFYSATPNGEEYSFPFYSVFIREGQGSLNQLYKTAGMTDRQPWCKDTLFVCDDTWIPR